MMTFGEKLLLLRKKKGLSQEQLASELSVSRQAISKWEVDDSFPELKNIIQISELFDTSLDYLLKNDKSLEKDVNLNVIENKMYLMIGLGCMIFSVISFSIVWILEKIYPAPLWNYNSKTGLWTVGLNNFVITHSLENFMRLITLIFIVGSILVFNKRIKQLYNYLIKKIKVRQ